MSSWLARWSRTPERPDDGPGVTYLEWSADKAPLLEDRAAWARLNVDLHGAPDAAGRYPHQYRAGFFRGGRVVELPQPERWDCLGYKPRPITRWQRFRSHLGHGLLMQYPIRDVLGFSFRGLWWRMEPRPGVDDD